MVEMTVIELETARILAEQDIAEIAASKDDEDLTGELTETGEQVYSRYNT